MNRFISLFVLTAIALCVCSTTASVFRAPPDISMSYPMFTEIYSSLDEEAARPAYQLYRNVLVGELLRVGRAESFELETLAEQWRRTDEDTVPDVKPLHYIVGPLKKNAIPKLDLDRRRHVYAYLKVYLEKLRLFNLKNELLNNESEVYLKRDSGDHVGAAGRALYRSIKADVLDCLDEQDRIDFQNKLNAAARVRFIVPMGYRDFEIFGRINATWYQDRRFYRRYLKEMYLETDPANAEEYQYKKDLWIAEGKQGMMPDGQKGTEDMRIPKERTLADLQVVVPAVEGVQLDWTLRRPANQYLTMILRKLKGAAVQKLAIKENQRYLRTTIMKIVDRPDRQQLLGNSPLWNDVVEKVRSEKKKLDDSDQPPDFYGELMTFEVFSKAYGPHYENRTQYKMYIKDMLEVTDPGHVAAYESRQRALAEEERRGTPDGRWNNIYSDRHEIEHIKVLVAALKPDTLEPVLRKQLYEYFRVFLFKLEFWTVQQITKDPMLRALKTDIFHALKDVDVTKLSDEAIYQTFWKDFFPILGL